MMSLRKHITDGVSILGLFYSHKKKFSASFMYSIYIFILYIYIYIFILCVTFIVKILYLGNICDDQLYGKKSEGKDIDPSVSAEVKMIDVG